MVSKLNADGSIKDDPNAAHNERDLGNDAPSLYMGVNGKTQEKSTTLADADSLIKDGNLSNFMVDVIEESEMVPVIVDFWAPWCGPCKTLGPILERLVVQAQGTIKLVKVNVDENQDLAGQMRVQSIPAVYAFHKGQPVDGFTGAVSESQIKTFIDKLLDGAILPIDAILNKGQAGLDNVDGELARDMFQQALNEDPSNVKATAGMIRAAIILNDSSLIDEILLELADEVRTSSEVSAAIVALELSKLGSKENSSLKSLEVLKSEYDLKPEDQQVRLDYASALIMEGQNEAAVAELLGMIKIDPVWNDAAARKQVLKVFESLGHTDPITISGRRELSSLIFS